MKKCMNCQCTDVPDNAGRCPFCGAVLGGVVTGAIAQQPMSVIDRKTPEVKVREQKRETKGIEKPAVKSSFFRDLNDDLNQSIKDIESKEEFIFQYLDWND